MKRIVPILSIITIMAVLVTACGRKSETQSAQALSYTDTVGLAQFQNWKYQNERLDPNQYYQQAVQTTAPVRKTTARKTSTNYGSGSMNSVSQNQAKTTQKKGWSKAAKGAAIGGGAGAIAGAVLVKKNRVAGGALGAIAGGAIGYFIGKSKDKKDGRY
jgi:predicted acetyltransferase